MPSTCRSPFRLLFLSVSVIFCLKYNEPVFAQLRSEQPIIVDISEISPIAIALSPNDKLLAIVGSTLSGLDGRIVIWDIHNKKKLKIFDFSDSIPFCVKFSPDNKTLAVSGSGQLNKIHFWSTHTFKEIDSDIILHDDVVTSFDYSTNGKWLISSSVKNGLVDLFLWDLESHKAVKSFASNGSSVNLLTFAHNSRSFAAVELAKGGDNRNLLIWDTDSDNESLKLANNENIINKLAFSNADDKLISADSAGNVYVFDLKGKSKERIMNMKAQNGGVFCFCITNDGRIFTGGYQRNWGMEFGGNGTVCIYSKDGQKKFEWTAHARANVTNMCLSTSATLLVTASTDNTVAIWELK